MRKVH